MSGAPRRVPRGGILALALAVTLALCGCAGLSTKSSVRQGLDITIPESNRIQVNYPPPAPGASMEQIARGFIRAGSATGGDYTSAKLFLAPQLARTWVPDAEVVVFAGDSAIEVRPSGESTADIVAEAVAVIDSDGRYRTLAPGTRRTAALSFARVDGEWRIAALPPGFGRWIPASGLHRLLQPFSIHYVATDRRLLVDDVRWLPLDHLPSRLARAQLRPVPADLHGVATTAVAPGTRLTADSVTVVSGVATVDLSRLPSKSQEVRQDLWAQFAATMTQDPSVIGVVVQVAGATLELSGSPSPVTSPSDVGFPDPPAVPHVDPLVRRGDTLFPFDADAAARGRDPDGRFLEPDPGQPRIPSGYVNLALSRDGAQIAAVSSDRATLARWQAGTRYDVPFFGTALGRPRYDSRGVLWVGAIGAPSSGSPAARLWAVATFAGPAGMAAARPVRADWLAGRRVVDSTASPNAERLAVLSTDAHGRDPRIEVAGVLRDTSGMPTRLAAPVRLGALLAGISGLSWLDDTTLATLADVGGSEPAVPYLLGLAGDETGLTPVAGARAIASTSGGGSLEVITGEGEIRTRAGRQWISAGTGTELLVAAG